MGSVKRRLHIIWKPIPSISKYEVSDLGEIRNAASFNLVSRHLGASGWFSSLYRNGSNKATTTRLTPLICETFLGPKPAGKFCRHLDGDVSNDQIDNLIYDTRTNIIKSRTRTKKSRPRRLLTPADVQEITRLHAAGMSINKISKQVDRNIGVLSKLLRGVRK